MFIQKLLGKIGILFLSRSVCFSLSLSNLQPRERITIGFEILYKVTIYSTGWPVRSWSFYTERTTAIDARVQQPPVPRSTNRRTGFGIRKRAALQSGQEGLARFLSKIQRDKRKSVSQFVGDCWRFPLTESAGEEGERLVAKLCVD